jgi:hypothetical protein
MKKLLLLSALTIVFVNVLFSQNVPSYVPTNGLVGYWPFNGNANDESGNGNNGSVNGATLASDRFSNINSSYSFENPNSKISLSTISSDSISSISISGWFKKSIAGIDAAIFAMSNGCNGADGLRLFIGNDNFLYWGVEKTSCIGVGVYSNLINYADNNWHFFVASYNKSNPTYVTTDFSLWIDGVNVGISNTKSAQGINSPISNNLFSTTIGNHNLSTNRFTGSLDDIAIYNRALSDQEVKQLYEGCTKETATSSSFNALMYTTNAPANLTATPTGGTFSGDAVTNNAFNPSKAKLGKNTIKYNFKNTTGCADSTNFTMILVDTLGNKCSTYDTLKIKMKITTGIKTGQQTSMNIYPNPTSDKLIIETNDIQALSGYKYKILDLQGKEVYNALATSAKTEISLKSIGAKGMYILHIQDANNETIQSKQIVLE